MVERRLNQELEEIDNFTSRVEKDMKEQGFHKAHDPEGYLPLDLKIFRELMRTIVYPLTMCLECGNKYLVVRYFYKRGGFVPHYCCNKCKTVYEINNGGTLIGKKLR